MGERVAWLWKQIFPTTHSTRDMTVLPELAWIWAKGDLALISDSPVRSCDYSRVAVAEMWVGEQEAAAAAAAVAGQYRGGGSGQTGMRWLGCTLLGHLEPYLRQRGDPPRVVSASHEHTTPGGPNCRALVFLPCSHSPTHFPNCLGKIRLLARMHFSWGSPHLSTFLFPRDSNYLDCQCLVLALNKIWG